METEKNAIPLSTMDAGNVGYVSDNPLTQARAIEWLALKFYVLLVEMDGDGDYGGKSYDPMTIDLNTNGGGTAHSYVFNLRDGGRHHGFQDLASLETALWEEAIKESKQKVEMDWLVKQLRNCMVEAQSLSNSPQRNVDTLRRRLYALTNDLKNALESIE